MGQTNCTSCCTGEAEKQQVESNLMEGTIVRKHEKFLDRPVTPRAKQVDMLRFHEGKTTPRAVPGLSKRASLEVERKDWSKMTSTEKWTKLMIRARFRQGTQCCMPPLFTVGRQSEAQIQALTENWAKLQDEWQSLDEQDKKEIRDYFNLIGNGFGDFMFKGENHQVLATFKAMSVGDSLNCLKKLKDSKLVEFIDPKDLAKSEMGDIETLN